MTRTELRMTKFHSFKGKPIYGTCYAHLSKEEIAWCERFIIENGEKDSGAFYDKATRLFLDSRAVKPKHNLEIVELLLWLKDVK